MSDDRERKLRERAYEHWKNDGEHHGRDIEHWLQAEREIYAQPDATSSREVPPTPHNNRRVATEPKGPSGQGKSRPHHGDKPGTTGERANVAKTDTDFTVLPDGTVLPIPADRK